MMDEFIPDDANPFKEEKDSLWHYGTPRHSGRYPWGSGENPYQRSLSFRSHVNDLKKKGFSELEISKQMGMTTKQLRARYIESGANVDRHDEEMARKLKEKGWSIAAISRNVGRPDSTIRGWLNSDQERKRDAAYNTANMLEEQIKKSKFVNVGKGTELYLNNISADKKDVAIQILEDRGYKKELLNINTGQPGKPRKMLVLMDPSMTKKDAYDHAGEIPIAGEGNYTENHGDSWRKIEPPIEVKRDRIWVNYTTNGRGGVEKDGVIELRRDVPDISLGKALYAQVRIAVEGGKYMKGMAVYSDDIPDGYDIVYNTNKTPAQEKKVFKEMRRTRTGEIDVLNPFGATVKTDDDPESEKRDLIRCQRHYKGADGKEHQSALNIVNEEGDWETWGRTLSAQMLSKQRPAIARERLAVTFQRKMDEFKEIMGLTNPTIQKELLVEFADGCDTAAAHLKAAAIPGSASHVILPDPTMRENEVFAPNYTHGSRVVLVRYPHAGPFEAAELTVNNNYRKAAKMIGKDSPDAIVINPKVAEKLSGADFDGDTVTVIPNDSGAIKTMPRLKGLIGYEPKVKYARPDDSPIKTGKPKPTDPPEERAKYDGFDTQMQMGLISNLITDMTIKKAPYDEIERAVKHSMTVIDAEKHNLDWRKSYDDNGIAELGRQYQGVTDRGRQKGASTLISKANSKDRIPERKEGKWENGRRVFFDPETGERYWEDTGRKYKVFKTLKNGDVVEEWKEATIKVPKMSRHGDAYELSSGTVIESIYADHANRLKALANRARKETLSIRDIEQNQSAKKQYAREIASLNEKLKDARRNKPLETKAQALASSLFKLEKAEDPTLVEDKDKAKKTRARLLKYARDVVGSNRRAIKFNDREWEAIQSGAVSKTFLLDLIKESDKNDLKQRAMPRNWVAMSPAKLSKARQMIKNGGTMIEVAQAMGVSTTALYNALNGDDDD